MVGKHIGIDLPYDEPIEVVKDAPQQEAGSVDWVPWYCTQYISIFAMNQF